MGPDSSSQQLAIINTKANKNYPNVSSPVIIEPRKNHQIRLESGINKIEDANLTLDFGLSDWKFDHGIEFAPNSGINGTGAIRFAAKAYVPERPNSWRTAKAFLCLPAVNIDAVSIEASIMLEDIPQNTSAHPLSLTWFKSENCQSGGQHGGYAYIEKKLG
jgi:hypothetical protein